MKPCITSFTVLKGAILTRRWCIVHDGMYYFGDTPVEVYHAWTLYHR